MKNIEIQLMIEAAFQISGEKGTYSEYYVAKMYYTFPPKIIHFDFRPCSSINSLWLRELNPKHKTMNVSKRKCSIIFITIWWGKSKQNTDPEP